MGEPSLHNRVAQLRASDQSCHSEIPVPSAKSTILVAKQVAPFLIPNRVPHFCSVWRS